MYYGWVITFPAKSKKFDFLNLQLFSFLKMRSVLTEPMYCEASVVVDDTNAGKSAHPTETIIWYNKNF